MYPGDRADDGQGRGRAPGRAPERRGYDAEMGPTGRAPAPPRAYDRDLAPAGRLSRRVERRRRSGTIRAPGVRDPRVLSTLRQAPVRNGLIGLAVAGVAAPLAVNRHQQALRTDPAHENMIPNQAGVWNQPMDDEALAGAWAALDSEEQAEAAFREAKIDESLEKFASYNLSRDLAERIFDAAAEHEIDPDVAFGLVRAESSFRNSSTSRVGAIGLTQLMPNTARWLQPGVTMTQLRDPDTNLSIGFRYLRDLINKYDGNERLALIAYNRGPGTVDRAIKRGQNPDNGYADFVAGKENHGHRLFTNR